MYQIEITNKTDNIVYIDKAFCFVNDSEQKSNLSYHSNTQSTVSKGGNTGAGLNLGAVTGALGVGGALGTLAGGVTVGGSSSNSASTTYSNERILAIPPRGRVVFSKQDFEKVKSKQYLIRSVGESFAAERELDKKNYTEDDSPLSKSYVITYSLSPDFKNTKTMNFVVYVKEVKLFEKIATKYDTFVRKYTHGVDDSTIIIGYLNW